MNVTLDHLIGAAVGSGASIALRRAWDARRWRTVIRRAPRPGDSVLYAQLREDAEYAARQARVKLARDAEAFERVHGMTARTYWRARPGGPFAEEARCIAQAEAWRDHH